MKSKFTPVVKMRKQLLDLAEVELAKSRAKSEQLKEQIGTILQEINSQEIPQSGNFAQALHVKAVIEQMMRHKGELQTQMLENERVIDECMNGFKEARKEYEKMKYLEQEELKEIMKKLKKQEQADIDEIASVLFVLGDKNG